MNSTAPATFLEGGSLLATPLTLFLTQALLIFTLARLLGVCVCARVFVCVCVLVRTRQRVR